MKRPLYVAAVALFVLSCSEAGIQPIDESKNKLVDDLLTVNGEVCTTSPDDVTFPVKIMIIVDASGSMQFTDPSAKTTTTTYPNITQANAQASCLSACATTSTPAATCTKMCTNPTNPGRQGAVQILVDRFKNNPSVSFSIIRFNGRVTINGAASSTVGDFTNDTSTLNKAIASLAQADITTDYQGALTSAYQVLEKDMLQTSPVDRARTKYVIIFLSDGAPNPVCKEGCGNDSVDIGGGIILDNWCDVPRDKWCQNFNVASTQCTDMTKWYPHMKEPCRAYNTSDQLKQRVLEITSLADTYSVGDLRFHTAFLFDPTLPLPIQDLMAVEGSSNTACTKDTDCPAGPISSSGTACTSNANCKVQDEVCVSSKCGLQERCIDKFCKGKSEALLIDMAKWGDGVFRNFSSGQQIDFLNFNYSSVARPFGMTNFIVSNVNALPNFDRLDVDTDGDGVDDETEFSSTMKMSSSNRDSDNDGYNDKLEHDRRLSGFDPGDPKKPESACGKDGRLDLDGDGLNECEEKVLATDPKIVDSDRDRIPDGIEFLWGTNPLALDDKLDMDFDGKLAGEEIRLHASPTTADPKIHANFKYIYDVKEQPARPDLKKCYKFTVRRIRLVQTSEAGGKAGTLGYNEILLFFGQGPADDPRDYGKYKGACVRAQYVTDTFKVPAGGQVKLVADDFQDLEKLMNARGVAGKNPACKTTPPGPGCKDPCKGAPMP
jgi:hypothetical protein